MSNGNDTVNKKRAYLSQTEIPRFSLEKSLVIANVLWDEFAGKNAEPLQIVVALKMSPTSGHWRNLCGASIAYGLTEGGYNAKEIVLTPRGRSIVAPTDECGDKTAIIEAVMMPSIIKAFFEKYDKAKLPSETIAQNVLMSLGLPKDRVKEALEIIIGNGRFAGIITDIKTGSFVSISAAYRGNIDRKSNQGQEIVETQNNNDASEKEDDIEEFARKISEPPQEKDDKKLDEQKKMKNNKVFISHGKNKQIVEQL
jgi:hypothetical protein